MLMRDRRELATVAVAVAVVLGGLGTAVVRGGAWNLFQLVAALTLIAAAVVLRRDPEQRRSGALLLTAAVLLPLASADAISWKWGAEIAAITTWWPLLPITVVLVTYPGGVAGRRWHRWLLIAIGINFVVLWGLGQVLWNPRGGFAEPTYWVTVWDVRPLYSVVWLAAWVGGVLLPLAACVVFVQRWRATRGLARAAVRSVSLVGIVLAVPLAANFLTGLLGPTGWWHLLPVDPAQTLTNVDLAALAVAPVGLLLEALRRRAAQLSTMDDLLAAGTDPQRVRTVLRTALADPSLQLSVAAADPDRPSWLAVSQDGLTLCDDPRTAVAPGRIQREIRAENGNLLAVVDTADAGPADEAQVRTVLAAAAVVLENTRLHASLLARLTELQLSRTRIVEAGLLERRRVERDLHDGAQQLLLSVASSLGRIELVGDDTSARRSALNDARTQLSDALAELRRLARGIHPALLSQAGLGAALHSLAESCPIYPVLDVAPHLEQERFNLAVEATVWFVAAEAVTNVVKHAQATSVHIGLRTDGAELVLTVRDDGRGGAIARPDGGLAGLADRVGALGGKLSVEPAPERGTLVTAVVPCGS